MPKSLTLVSLVWLLSTLAPQYALAEKSDRELFEEKILPVLKKHCFECHSSKAKKVESGFLLDTRAGLLRGGEMGTVIVPGKPEESPLLGALRYEKLEMPPSAKLPSEIADDFEEWIRRGAPDPREE